MDKFIANEKAVKRWLSSCFDGRTVTTFVFPSREDLTTNWWTDWQKDILSRSHFVRKMVHVFVIRIDYEANLKLIVSYIRWKKLFFWCVVRLDRNQLGQLLAVHEDNSEQEQNSRDPNPLVVNCLRYNYLEKGQSFICFSKRYLRNCGNWVKVSNYLLYNLNFENYNSRIRVYTCSYIQICLIKHDIQLWQMPLHNSTQIIRSLETNFEKWLKALMCNHVISKYTLFLSNWDPHNNESKEYRLGVDIESKRKM